MIRRLIAALVLLASGCLTPAPLVAQAPARYILSIRGDVPGATDSAIAAVGRVGGRARINSATPPVTVLALVPASRVRDSLWLATDTSRVLVTGPWRRWLEAAEYDGVVSTPPDSSEVLGGALAIARPWGLSAIGADSAWAMGARGQGIIVTAMDSGIDPFHPGYAVAGGWNAVARADTGWADDISSCRGHGTHTAGTMAGREVGVAPEARLYGIKVFQDLGGSCLSYSSTQVAGINWAVAHGSRAVNVSISGTGGYSYEQAVLAARAAGTLVCRANGNSGTTPPQGAPSEIQTSALGSSLTREGYANYGPSPQTDLAAPGGGVESTMPGGGYGTKSGTSMAAPHVCGAAALVMSRFPALSADSVLIALQRSAQPLGSPIPNDYTGWGLVRPDRAIAWLQGGVAIAATTTDSIPPTAPLVPVCKPVVALGPWTATSSAPWLRVTTTADSLCYTIDPALVPTGTSTVTGTITTRSTP